MKQSSIRTITATSSIEPVCHSPEKLSSSAGKTALHLAAEQNQAGVVHVLLQWMPDPNSKDEQGRTALHLAVALNYVEVVKELLGESLDGGSVRMGGSSVDINTQDELGKSALHIAAMAGYRPMVELLLQAHQVDTDLKDYEGYSPLHRAALAGWDGVVEVLVKKGADLNMKVG